MELLQRNLNLLDNVLETLDLQHHSLGVMYIVAAKISEIQVSHRYNIQHIDIKNCLKSLQNEDPEPVLSLVKRFVTICNGEQVRNAPQTCKLHPLIL